MNLDIVLYTMHAMVMMITKKDKTSSTLVYNEVKPPADGIEQITFVNIIGLNVPCHVLHAKGFFQSGCNNQLSAGIFDIISLL